MVPRKPSPEGKRNTVCAKVTDDELALIDARCARRGQIRSAWLQSLIAADLAEVADAGEVHGIRIRSDPQMPPGVVAVVSPGKPGARLLGARPRCPHSGTRVIGGWCKECQAVVEPGGFLAR
jgi:hypothetical protein